MSSRGIWMSSKDIWKAFKLLASNKGYTEKVVGDYAYRSSNGSIIRLKGSTDGSLHYWQQGVGYRSISLRLLRDQGRVSSE